MRHPGNSLWPWWGRRFRAISRTLLKLWGRPPGLRGTPPSRGRNNGISILQGAGGFARHPSQPRTFRSLRQKSRRRPPWMLRGGPALSITLSVILDSHGCRQFWCAAVRIFTNKAFMRFANKAGIGDVVLCEAIRYAERGLIAADLGGGLIKQRTARPGQGKSGGFRTLIVDRKSTRLNSS